SDAHIYDAELSAANNFSGSTLTLARNGGGNAEDALAFDGTNVTTSGSNVIVGGVTVGTYTFTGGELTISFNSNATQARVDTVAQNIVYWNTNDAPPASVQIDWTFDDGNTADAQGTGGALQANGSTTVNIIDVPNPATLTVPIAQSVDEDVVLTFSSGGGNAIVVDSGSSYDPIVTATLSVVDGSLTLSGTTGITFFDGTSNGSATLTISGTEADINAALDGLQYQGTSNYNGAVTLTITTGSSSATETGLYARYEFLNGSTADESGNGYNGTAVGDPSLTNDAERGDVLTFDGNDRVTVTNGTLGLADEVTIAAWVKLDAGQQDNVFLSIGDEFYITLDKSNASYSMALTASNFTTNSLNSDHNIAGEGWTHIAATINDVTKETYLYLNGVLIKSSTFSFSDIDWATATSQNITIGSMSDGSNAFVGSIDDVRIYNTELSRTEIIAVMGDNGYDSESVNLTVNSVNDQPQFNNLNGNPTFVEGGSPVVLDADVTFFDADIDRGEDNFDTINLNLQRNGGANSEDVFTATGNLGPLTEGGNLVLSSTTIGVIANNSGGILNIQFNSLATQAQVNEVLQSIAYSNSSDTPPASVQIDWSMEDGNTASEQGSGGEHIATGSSTVNITAVNDAPVLSNAYNTELTTITEDETSNAGQTVASIIASSGQDIITDVDGDPEGIAVIGTNDGNGHWEFSTNGGSNWSAFGVTSGSNALLLSGTDLIRFVPNGDAGTSVQVYFRAWDGTSGSAGTFVNIGAVGGSSAFSSDTETAQLYVTDVNDAPSGADKTITFNEDTTYTLTAADFGFSDIDGDAFDRVWIMSLPGQGQLLFNGSTFAANNWVLKSDIDLGLLTFEPSADANGTGYASFDFQVQDDGGTANGGQNRDASSNTITFDVTAQNDDPVVDHGGPYLISEGDSLSLDASGTTDVDSGTLTYRWDLNNDATYDITTTSATIAPAWSALNSFGIDDDGVYTIGLQVDDGAGGVVTTSTTVTVTNVAPTLTATGAATAGGGATYTLTLTDVDPGNDTISQWIVNWGDGSIDTYVGDPASVTHVYSNELAGLTFDITVSAIDEDGQYFEANLLAPAYGGDYVNEYDGINGTFVGSFAPSTDGISGHANIV
ncbi:MAG: hypothetical protein KDA87_22660, partial [Planctomycetales bacterium]|nr:hypothetical protein [Planctomycetales bacterium]